MMRIILRLMDTLVMNGLSARLVGSISIIIQTEIIITRKMETISMVDTLIRIQEKPVH